MIEKVKLFLWENLNPRQIVLKNAFWLYLSEFFGRGLKFLVFLLIARFLGPKILGSFEYLFSFIGMFFIFADFGISSIFIRDYQQREEKNKLINQALILKFFLSVIFGLLAFIGYFFSKKIEPFIAYFVLVFFYVLQNIENFFEAYFIATQRAEKKFIFNLMSSVSLLFFILLGIIMTKNVMAIVLSYVLSIFVSNLIAFSFFRREIKLDFQIDLSFFKNYLFNGLPLALFGLLGYLFFSTDKIIISHFRTLEETGYYSAASRIVLALFAIPGLFNTALFPWLAKKAKEKDKRIKRLFNLMVISLIFIGILFSLVSFFLAPYVIYLIFGRDFALSVSIFQVLIWIIVFVYPTSFLDFFLLSHNKQWLDFFLTIIPAFLNVILSLLLVPSYGVFGAVYASLFSQFLNFVLTLAASLRILEKTL